MQPAFNITAPTLSATGCEWVLREADERNCVAIMQRHDLPEVLSRILCLRGVTIDEVEHFLNPSLKVSMPDPMHLLDMDKAAARVAQAITNNERIAIFGDYDVDGATSSALLMRYFRALGAEPLVYIPDRMKEGYGPNAPALLSLKEQGAKVVITVDCGTLSFEPLQAAQNAGLDVIVIDHHQGEARKPAAVAVVNPNRLDETSPHRHLAAVGVAFLLAVAVNKTLREQGWFASRPEPDLRSLLDIVALGTVADVVPLIGVNRAFVAQGLKVMASRGNIGISTILDVASVASKPAVYHAGFVIGPRINAGGRVGKSDLGVRLLTTEDPAEALMLARELERHNAERKAIESMVLEDAMNRAEAMDKSAPLLLVAGNNWHQGVIGIVAGRLKERYHKPTAIIAVENGIGKASARSVSGVDFGAAVIAAREAGLLIAGGGHAMAAGFTVEEQKIVALAEFLNQRFAPQCAALSPHRQLMIDGALNIGGATTELVEIMERIGPFGQGNPSIRLLIRGAINLKPEPVGENHVRTLLTCRLSSARLKGIAFRALDSKLGKALMATRGQPVDLVGQLKIEEWNGKRSVGLTIEDISAA